VAECLTSDEYRPRELFKSFGIEVLATTDDPCDDLAHHAALAADTGFDGRVVPTFRPDRYLEPGRPGFAPLMGRLAEASGEETADFPGYLRALAQRRGHFKEHGAVSADHSHADVVTLELAPSEAARIYAAALRGEASTEESTALRRHMMIEMAQMSVDDGLVMTLHPGVHRNHHTPTLEEYGPDTGHDIPVGVEFTRSLQPLLDRFGTAPDLHLVLFTVDETVFSREIAPLAGFYPAVYAGVPWWFLDAPEAIRRYRGAVTETLGFYRTSGFIDDTRAFCSIPARHDMSRRLDSAYLAELVVQHRLDEDEAFETGTDLVTTIPRQVFKL
jgi:glucuronate isomerase